MCVPLFHTLHSVNYPYLCHISERTTISIHMLYKPEILYITFIEVLFQHGEYGFKRSTFFTDWIETCKLCTDTHKHTHAHTLTHFEVLKVGWCFLGATHVLFILAPVDCHLLLYNDAPFTINVPIWCLMLASC